MPSTLLTRTACMLALLLGGGGTAGAQTQAEQTTQKLIAFIHADVRSMVDDRLLRDQTVIVDGGKIVALGAKLAPPTGAVVVDAKGAVLSPGLADMHMHSDSRQDMAVNLAYGVTTALNLGEASNAFVGRLRGRIASGSVPGPRVFTALAVDGSTDYAHLVVKNCEDAVAAVRLAKSNGYEFIKVYNNLSAPAFAALIKEAAKTGLGIAGHDVRAVGMRKQLEAGQGLIAHLEEYFYSWFPQPADGGQAAPSDNLIAEAVETTRRSGAYVVADLFTYQTIAGQFGKPEVVTAHLARPEVRWLSPRDRIDWKFSGYQSRKIDLSARAAFAARLAKALADGGVPLVLGTDAPTIPGLVPGKALHDDMLSLEAAGLTRLQVLAAATRNAGAFAAKSSASGDRFGVVDLGARADLVLTAADPGGDLDTLRRPLGVMAAGRWYDRAALDALLLDVESRYKAAMPTP